MEKKTAGQIIEEHRQKFGLELQDDVIEYRRAMEPEMVKRVHHIAEKVKNVDLYYNQDFYVVLATRADRVLNEPKPTLFVRKSCPTPVYKQSVWKYRHFTGDLEFLWSIPSEGFYYHILQNKMAYLEDKEFRLLAQFVILMESGEILNWVKKENGYKKEAALKIISNEEQA